MKIVRSGALPSNPGPEAYFTGTVRIDPLFQAEAPGRAAGAQVTFEPGARTAWHTHPAGQTLIVTFGRGRVQREGGPVEEIRQLVNSALPGIPLRPLPVAPRQIPYHAGVVYFELDRDSPHWGKMSTSGGIAVHVSGEFPGLKMELWAIRQG